MRAKPRWVGLAAWLGLLALALNALVPIHIAFDVAAAVGAASPSFLAELTGHHHHAGSHTHDRGDGKGHDHGAPAQDKGDAQTACAVCLTLAALAGFVPAAPVALPALPPTATVSPAAAIAVVGASIVLAYRSRAPPIG